MKRIIYLLPVAALLMGVQSCCCDKDDDNNSAPVAAPAIQPNGDLAVDLGLSVRWATCNVGANTPEEYGDYYAWGDTTTYYEPGYAQEKPQNHWKEGKADGYCLATYKYNNSLVSWRLTKYCNVSEWGYEGYTDSDTTLLLVDDVAHYKWGGNWRMPTRAEFEELLDNCDCVYTIQNSVKGLKVTSRKDPSQSIFLPAAGYYNNKSLASSTTGYYRSSSLYTGDPCRAWKFQFGQNIELDLIMQIRYEGYSVRPVFP